MPVQPSNTCYWNSISRGRSAIVHVIALIPIFLSFVPVSLPVSLADSSQWLFLQGSSCISSNKPLTPFIYKGAHSNHPQSAISECVCVCIDHSKCPFHVDTWFQSLKGSTKLSHVLIPFTFDQLQQRTVIWEQSITALSSGSSRQGFEVVIEWKQHFLCHTSSLKDLVNPKEINF